MDEKTRLILFFTLCIGVRGGLVYLAWKYAGATWFRILTLLIGLGLIGNGLMRTMGIRKEKGFSGGEVYWNSYIHGFLYLLFTLAAYYEMKNAWVFLLMDLFLGIFNTVNHYFF